MGMDDTTHTRGKGAGVKKEEAQAKTLTTTNHKDNEPQDNHRPFSFFPFSSTIPSICTPSLVKKSGMGFGKKKT